SPPPLPSDRIDVCPERTWTREPAEERSFDALLEPVEGDDRAEVEKGSPHRGDRDAIDGACVDVGIVHASMHLGDVTPVPPVRIDGELDDAGRPQPEAEQHRPGAV